MLGIPGMTQDLAKTKLQEALQEIYQEQFWSFQIQHAGWLTPGLLGIPGTVGQSPGTITVSPYSDQITGDATASAAWTGLVGRPFITEMQIRVPYYALYDIIAIDATVPTAVVLTISRPWMEPAQTNGAYMIYQAYFPVPQQNFKKFMDARDTTNNNPMDYWTKTQMSLSVEDPQRTDFDQPAYIVAFDTDTRPNSATLGNMRYELWPHPLSQLPYSFDYLFDGPQLVKATDTVPYPLTEAMLKEKGYELCYRWKESQKGDDMERGSGANWMVLAGAASARYKVIKKQRSILDRGMVDLYKTKFRRNLVDNGQPYATITGQLSVGRF